MHLTALRAWVSPWPGVEEGLKWGNDHVFSVAGRMFCIVDGDAGRISFQVARERFLEITDRPGVVPAPYLARAHWVQLTTAGALAETELRALLRTSYEGVRARLPKAKQRVLAD